MDDNGRFFTIIENNNSTEYEILLKFTSVKTAKNYLIFTDNDLDEDGYLTTFAASYENSKKSIKLKNIETDSEWDLIENVLANIAEKIEE